MLPVAGIHGENATIMSFCMLAHLIYRYLPLQCPFLLRKRLMLLFHDSRKKYLHTPYTILCFCATTLLGPNFDCQYWLRRRPSWSHFTDTASDFQSRVKRKAIWFTYAWRRRALRAVPRAANKFHTNVAYSRSFHASSECQLLGNFLYTGFSRPLAYIVRHISSLIYDAR